MLVITGTGRSGTSAITKWLNELGLIEYQSNWINKFNAGLEPSDVSKVNGSIWIGNDPDFNSIKEQKKAIKKINYPVIKDPKFFYGEVLSTWLEVRDDLQFLVCIRNFSSVYKSRQRVSQLAQAKNPTELRQAYGNFMYNMNMNHTPNETIVFPDFLNSFDEVWGKINRLSPELLKGINEEYARSVWDGIMDKSQVNF